MLLPIAVWLDVPDLRCRSDADSGGDKRLSLPRDYVVVDRKVMEDTSTDTNTCQTSSTSGIIRIPLIEVGGKLRRVAGDCCPVTAVVH